MVHALNFITVDDLATEIQKHHHDSNLLRTLVADLRAKRVDLKEFCKRIRTLIGAPVLVATVKGLRGSARARLQQREHQLALAGVRRRRTRRSGKSWLASVCCSTAPPISEGA